MMSSKPEPKKSNLTHLALDAADIGVWSLDLEKNIITYDATCQLLFELESTMTYEAAFNRIYHEDASKVKEKLALAFEPQGDGMFAEEFRLIIPNGKPKWILAKGVTTFTEGNDIRTNQFVGTMQDIHKRKIDELELAEREKILETRVAKQMFEIRRLAASLTLAEQKERQVLAKTLHDSVQQELYAIQFAVAGLKRATKQTEKEAAFSEINQILLKTMQMTRDIGKDLRPAILDDNDLCQTLRWLATQMKEKYGLTITLEGIESCEIPAEAMRALTFNLVRELLFNIVKHADINEAKLSIELLEDFLIIKVQDKGKGFKIEAFSDTQGTGLGLSGARKRLELFGGSLSINSSLGTGTCITVQLPTSSFKL